MNAQPAPSNTVESVAEIPTARASGYLQQLCKHFSHKRPVHFDEREGRISFSSGDCRLTASEGTLRLFLHAPDAGQMALLQDVVVRHLVRFAFREELKIEWHGGTGGARAKQDRPDDTAPLDEHRLDEKVSAVLSAYHKLIRDERQRPREEAPGGRDGGQDRRMRAIGPDTGRRPPLRHLWSVNPQLHIVTLDSTAGHFEFGALPSRIAELRRRLSAEGHRGD